MDDSPESKEVHLQPEVLSTRNPIKRLYRWVLSWAERPSATWFLFFLAIAESSFFPVPPDVLMIALILGARKKAWWFASVSLAGTLIGGAIGYLIGWGLWEGTSGFWLTYVFNEETFNRVGELYNEWDAVAVFGAAFTPIPYKVFTIAAGVFKVNFAVFMVASLVGRAGRFFIVAAIFYWVGPRAKPFIEKYFNWIALFLVALLVAGFWLLGKI